VTSSGIWHREALVRTDVSEVLHNVLQFLDTANVIPSSPILVALMIQELSSYETSVLTRATRRNISEDGILHSHRSENFKSCRDLAWLWRGDSLRIWEGERPPLEAGTRGVLKREQTGRLLLVVNCRLRE
jgi:hypothetical protein